MEHPILLSSTDKSSQTGDAATAANQYSGLKALSKVHRWELAWPKLLPVCLCHGGQGKILPPPPNPPMFISGMMCHTVFQSILTLWFGDFTTGFHFPVLLSFVFSMFPSSLGFRCQLCALSVDFLVLGVKIGRGREGRGVSAPNNEV